MAVADKIPSIIVPEPYRGLGRILRHERLVGWVTFYGWQTRYLLADDWLLAGAAGGWIEEKEFGEFTGLMRLDEYRVEWIA